MCSSTSLQALPRCVKKHALMGQDIGYDDDTSCLGASALGSRWWRCTGRWWRRRLHADTYASAVPQLLLHGWAAWIPLVLCQIRHARQLHPCTPGTTGRTGQLLTEADALAAALADPAADAGVGPAASRERRLSRANAVPDAEAEAEAAAAALPARQCSPSVACSSTAGSTSVLCLHSAVPRLADSACRKCSPPDAAAVAAADAELAELDALAAAVALLLQVVDDAAEVAAFAEATAEATAGQQAMCQCTDCVYTL